MKDIREFRINIPQQERDGLHRRLDQTRFPEAETPDDWSRRLPPTYAKQLCNYWKESNNGGHFAAFEQPYPMPVASERWGLMQALRISQRTWRKPVSAIVIK